MLAEIDVQLVGLIKTLIDPENIMTEAAGVVSHMTITWHIHHCLLIYDVANCGEVIVYEALLQTLHAPTDGSTHGSDRFRASQQR